MPLNIYYSWMADLLNITGLDYRSANPQSTSEIFDAAIMYSGGSTCIDTYIF
jgi:hypothetical protein